MARALSNPVLLTSPEKGVDGRTTLAKARAPLITDGRIGDFFIDTRTDEQRLYGPKNAAGWPDLGLIKGNRGWSPVFSVAADGTRRVQRIIDWQGGEGVKPATGKYVGATGLVDAVADAVDIRGPQGPEMVINGLTAAAADIADNTLLPTAQPSDDNEKRSVVEVFDLGGALERRSVMHAQASTIRKNVSRVRIGYDLYERVAIEPASGAKFRSLDRWTNEGNSDSINGGWWGVPLATSLAALLLSLSGSIVDAGHYVTDPTNAATTTVQLQALIDGIAAKGGGTVLIGKKYNVQGSSLVETYSNEGADVAASSGCLVLRSGVHLVGFGKHSGSWLSCADPTKTIIFLVAPQNSGIFGIRLSNAWDYLESGAGHGVLVLATQGMADTTCRNIKIKDVLVEHVGSYGIGFQNGYPQNCVVDDIEIFNTGADGLDLKARGDSGEARGNYVTNVVVRKHGNRVTGSAGVDIRGVWYLKNITVIEFGDLNNAIFYSGIRFRSKPPVGSGYPDGSKSSLHGFRIDCSALAVGATANAVECGSDDVQIAAGVINGGTRGVVLSGNVDGVSNRVSVSGVDVYGTSTYNFFVGSGCEKTVFSSCFSYNAAGVGFRNEGNNTVFIACRSDNDVSAKTTSTAGANTEVALGSSFSADFGVNAYSPATGRVALQAKGASTDIDFGLEPKGNGKVRFGTRVASADAPITGYVEVKDEAGNLRRLALIG